MILRAFLANLIQTVIVMAATFIGALLFVIPGIIAGIYLGYSFSMTFYILADHPEYGPWQAIKESFRMMQGHKFRYFRLELSFIGWAILAAFTCGIGYLFLVPYQNAAYAIFYLNWPGIILPSAPRTPRSATELPRQIPLFAPEKRFFHRYPLYNCRGWGIILLYCLIRAGRAA